MKNLSWNSHEQVNLAYSKTEIKLNKHVSIIKNENKYFKIKI